jgi:hypothetical protein
MQDLGWACEGVPSSIPATLLLLLPLLPPLLLLRMNNNVYVRARMDPSRRRWRWRWRRLGQKDFPRRLP